MLALRPLGRIESCFKEKFGAPRQAHLAPYSTARLTVSKEYVPEQALRGLEGFSHVWLIWWFHLNSNKSYRPIIHPPRLQGKTIGVFASRSPHRPNPIGLSLAKLERVEGDTLVLSGIDLVDGTPVLDIKPYLPEADRAANVRTGWAGALKPRHLVVAFSKGASADVKGRPRLKGLIAQVLRHDQRNPRDKSQLKEGKTLEFVLHDRAVRFCVKGERARVLSVRKAGRRAEALARSSRERAAAGAVILYTRPQ